MDFVADFDVGYVAPMLRKVEMPTSRIHQRLVGRLIPSVFIAALTAVVISTPRPSFAAFADDDDEAQAQAESHPEATVDVIQAFLEGLRKRGYFDLERDYLESLRKAADTDAEFKKTIDFEIGKSLVDEAMSVGDYEKQREMLDQARKAFEAFLKANPKHPKAPEVSIQKAKILYQRGILARQQSDELEGPDKQSKIAEARTMFDQARTSYAEAVKPLQDAYAAFPPFIPETDKEKREAKRQAESAMMDARLQLALVDYEQAQTYPVGSKERNDLLDQGIKAFEELHKRFRTQMAGLTARAMQAKCFEERGDDGLGPAMGIYNELLDHSDPRVRDLQRKVAYFKIIALRKRKEFPLAADESARWLQTATPQQRRTAEGIAVRFELAKNIISQLPNTTREADKQAGIKKAVDELTEVVRYASPFKMEAIEYLRKYKPKNKTNIDSVAKLNFDEAMLQADEARSTNDWDRAIAYYKAAIRKVDPVKDEKKSQLARYQLSFSEYFGGRYEEADVVAEHLARNYPKGEHSAQSAAIAMAAVLSEYNETKSARDKEFVLRRLIDLAEYTVATWPDSEQGDIARFYLGEINLGKARYADAAKAFESVRTASSRRNEAVMKAGVAHWLMSKDKNQDEQAKTGIGLVQQAYKGRQEAGAPLTEPGIVANASELADIYLQQGKTKDAIAILEPHAKAFANSPITPDNSAVVIRLLTYYMRSHIADGQADQALMDMRRIEQSGGTAAAMTDLYFQLGKLLQKQMDDLARRNDPVGLKRTQETYQRVLKAVVDSKAGQTYESMEWAGESLLTLGYPQDAATVLAKVYETFGQNAEFAASSNGPLKLTRTRLKLAQAYIAADQDDKAKEIVDQLIKDNPKMLDAVFALGEYLEAHAKKTKSQTDYNIAFNHWSKLAQRMGMRKPRPAEYFESWYHAASVLKSQGKAHEAAAMLKGIMRQDPKVGTPEMKQKYENFIKHAADPKSQARAG